MTTYNFCTYFDQNYCARGLALYHSISRHLESFRIFILCLDDETYEILGRLHLPSAELIPLSDLESRDPVLFSTRDTRSLVEYYFTLTSAFILDTLKRHDEIDIISYIDADMYLFGPVQPIYDEMGESSILIIGHRFPDHLSHLEIYGRYNVGYLSFRRDKEGFLCLEKWREQCIEWCYDRLEGERFADQKYLDQWPALFRNITILHQAGVNVAPWNVCNYSFHEGKDGGYCLDDQPLTLYHFHGLKKMVQWGRTIVYDMNLNGYLKKGSIKQISGSKILTTIYTEYLLDLDESSREIEEIRGDVSIKERTIRFTRDTHGIDRYISAIVQAVRTGIHLCRKVIYQDVVTIRIPDRGR